MRIAGVCGLLALVAVVVAASITGSTSVARAEGAAYPLKWVDNWTRLVSAARGDGLAAAEAALARVPDNLSNGSVAAAVSGQGHWTFVNRDGQRFTAANEKEMSAVASALFPDGVGANGLTIYLGGSTVFVNRNHLAGLPAKARLRIVVGRASYPLQRIVASTPATAEGGAVDLVAAVRRDVLVPIGDERTFRETVWQMERPVKLSDWRVLALVADGPAALGPFPRRGADDALVVDRLAPQHLIAALSALAGRAAVITGRIDGERLWIRIGDGSETAVDLTGLRHEAATNDVGLVILNSKAPRQPGVRNWLWQKVDVDGLSLALRRDSVADFLGSLGLAGGKIAVHGKMSSDGRVRLTVVGLPEGIFTTSPGGLVGLIAELASEVMGTVVTSAVELDLARSGRMQELARRIVPGVHSLVQAGFVVLVALGLLALPVALRWWRAIWPGESRLEYGGWFGYQAARSVRFLAFFVLFLPVVSVPAILSAVLTGLRNLFAMALSGRGRKGGDDAAGQQA